MCCGLRITSRSQNTRPGCPNRPSTNGPPSTRVGARPVRMSNAVVSTTPEHASETSEQRRTQARDARRRGAHLRRRSSTSCAATGGKVFANPSVGRGYSRARCEAGPLGWRLPMEHTDIESHGIESSRRITATSFRVIGVCGTIEPPGWCMPRWLSVESRPSCRGTGSAGGTRDSRCAEWEAPADRPSLVTAHGKKMAVPAVRERPRIRAN